MIFTVLGRIVTVLLLLAAVVKIVAAFMIINGNIPQPEASNILYEATTGKAIDRGIELIYFALILGVLTDISAKIQKKE